MFNFGGMLGGGSSGTGQNIIYGSNGQPAGFMGSGTSPLLSWLFGGSVPRGVNLPPVKSTTTGGNTYAGPRDPRTNGGFGGGTGTGGGGVVIPPGGGTGGGGVGPQPGPTDWQYPGLLNAPYMMTNWFGK